MMQSKLASLTLKGFFAFALFLGVLFSSFAASAQQASPSLPLLFYARERLARPDLSSLVRFRFLTSVDFPTFNFTDQNGKLSCFNVDLAGEICSELEISD
ncbi:amino acid ABC transporter, partial [Rhizobium brockwellii]